MKLVYALITVTTFTLSSGQLFSLTSAGVEVRSYSFKLPVASQSPPTGQTPSWYLENVECIQRR